MSTVVRPSLLQAVRSIFAQDLAGRIQVLVGIDHGHDDGGILDTLRGEAPSHIAITVIAPGYSTSQRHGGLYSNWYGGSLKTALGYLANSRRIVYLDDDNWWATDHLSALLAAIEGKDWAFTLRTFVDKRLDEIICRDEWESLGPGKGVYVPGFGGFVDTNCLMLDKMRCHDVLPAWCMTRFVEGVGEDRMVFERIKDLPCGATNRYTVFYRHALDGVHPYLLWKMKQAGVDLARYVLPERMPPESVWAECAQHDAREAAKAAPTASPSQQQAQPAGQPARFVGAQFSITYGKR